MDKVVKVVLKGGLKEDFHEFSEDRQFSRQGNVSIIFLGMFVSATAVMVVVLLWASEV